MTGLWLVQAAAERLEQARGAVETALAGRLMGLVGIATMLAIAYAISYDRKRINWRMVGMGVALQFVLGVLVLKTVPGEWFFDQVGKIVVALLSFQEQGARFVFGNLVQHEVPLSGGLAGLAGGRSGRAAARYGLDRVLRWVWTVWAVALAALAVPRITTTSCSSGSCRSAGTANHTVPSGTSGRATMAASTSPSASRSAHAKAQISSTPENGCISEKVPSPLSHAMTLAN